MDEIKFILRRVKEQESPFRMASNWFRVAVQDRKSQTALKQIRGAMMSPFGQNVNLYFGELLHLCAHHESMLYHIYGFSLLKVKESLFFSAFLKTAESLTKQKTPKSNFYDPVFHFFTAFFMLRDP